MGSVPDPTKIVLFALFIQIAFESLWGDMIALFSP